jgi:hypothetical protein
LDKKKIGLTLIGEFFSFLGPKTHFRVGRHENKGKRQFYFGLRILLPIQIQLLDIESPKNPKIESPYYPALYYFQWKENLNLKFDPLSFMLFTKL